MIRRNNTDIIGSNNRSIQMYSLSYTPSPSPPPPSRSPSGSSSPSPSRSASPSKKIQPVTEIHTEIETKKSKKKGYLELILGPMFSGKTSTLKKIYDQCMYCNIPVMVINYGEKLSNTEVILINEGQFFADIEYVISLVEDMHKRVYICGLDGDFKKHKIGSLFELIPYCDNICKLKSLCSECRDGTPGLFSYRITNEVSQVVIGVDNYKPLCRVCYKRLTIEKESKQTARMVNGEYNYDV